MKKKLLLVLSPLIFALVVFIVLLSFMTITDYNPELKLDLEINHVTESEVSNEISIMTWNLGFAGLGKNSDFFMDGGEDVNPTREDFDANIEGIVETLSKNKVDIVFLQEVDRNSKRSFKTDMYEKIRSKVYETYNSSFATNYKVPYVFIPYPPIGKVHSGIATFSTFVMSSSKRIGFDINYSWPTRVLHLDRCLIVSRHSIKGTDKELVLINLHLSAYDDGGLRAEQLRVLKELMTLEYDNGNYVVSGGDFNQQFPTIDNSKYPVVYPDNYLPNTIDDNYLDADWNYAVSEMTPTYRLLNEVYNEDTSQVGVIDGFITSPNIEVIYVENLDLGFENSDHNPVVAALRLKK